MNYEDWQNDLGYAGFLMDHILTRVEMAEAASKINVIIEEMEYEPITLAQLAERLEDEQEMLKQATELINLAEEMDLNPIIWPWGDEPTGFQIVVRFHNGLKCSTVWHRGAYGYSGRLFELAVMDRHEKITYKSRITSDVEGYLSSRQVARIWQSMRLLTIYEYALMDWHHWFRKKLGQEYWNYGRIW